MNSLSNAFADILEAFFNAISEHRSEYHNLVLTTLRGKKQILNNKDNSIIKFLIKATDEIALELNSLNKEKQAALVSLSLRLQNHSFNEMFHSTTTEGRILLWELFSLEALNLLQYKDTSQDKHTSTTTTLPNILTAQAILDNKDLHIRNLRQKRRVNITQLNPNPISDPSKEILFTSNILLTVPYTDNIDKLDIPPSIKEKVSHIKNTEQQLYWYDHPMPIGIEASSNEMLYGLRGLSDMLAYEKKRGSAPSDAVLTVVLSVSVTHAGLSDIAQEYLQYELNKQGLFPGLDIYIITENASKEIAGLLDSSGATDDIASVFGVDGRYGRHYSFLKAIASVWKLCMDDNVRATFKIDLDQVFPQEVLVAQSGKSALEHFMTPLWGARGTDSEDNTIDLSMIAGGLVNESDISNGLFTPDVKFPKEPLDPIDLLFPRTLMMSISTRAEIMTQYTHHSNEEHFPDGISHALQRVHVTGGTNGILIDALQKYRPFTPSFIGRAEDQAYLMSVYKQHINNTQLRYLHAAGLIMRHDKAAFAGEAIKAAKFGTYAGDLLRTILFSRYAQILPGGIPAFKHLFAPFTSCFSTSTPILSVFSRLMLHSLSLFDTSETLLTTQLRIAADTLTEDIEATKSRQMIQTQYDLERISWNHFYDAIDTLAKQTHSTQVNTQIKKILTKCRIVDCLTS